MRIVCAPDSFKGTLTAREVAKAMATGIHREHPDATVDLCPIADGGEGTMQALVDATGGELLVREVSDPLAQPIDAAFALLPGRPLTAVVEMAAASGLTLLPERLRDPLRTSTFGTGQLIAEALDAGAHRVILAIGGSATHDGGCGAAQALGVKFLDQRGRPIAAPISGSDLERIHDIDCADRDPRLTDIEITLCCDVDNPLIGPNGAATVYGPQKGAAAEQVELLDRGLANLARLWRDRLGRDVTCLPGAGAAGGMGGGMVAMFGAELKRGIHVVLDAARFAERVRQADFCLTGEGRFDAQSLHGKACIGVSMIAREHGVPVAALVGSTSSDTPTAAKYQALGLTSVLPLRVDGAMATGADLERGAVEALRLLRNRV